MSKISYTPRPSMAFPRTIYTGHGEHRLSCFIQEEQTLKLFSSNQFLFLKHRGQELLKMRTKIYVFTSVVPSQDAGFPGADKGPLFKIGFLLRETLKVCGEGEKAEVAMSQCCYEQHFISIYSSELKDMNRLEQIVYDALHDGMHMNEQMAKEAKTSVATAIAYSDESDHPSCCTFEMEVVIHFLITKKHGPPDMPSGEHGHQELKRRIETENCSICLEDCSKEKNIVVTICHHLYHTGCIFQWLKRGSHTCPICRSDLGPMVGKRMTIP